MELSMNVQSKKTKILNEGLPVAYADPSVTPVPISALSVV